MSAGGIWQPKGVVAVLDTSALVAARLSRERPASPSRDVLRLAGISYDSFTSPAILGEVEAVLARPNFGFPVAETRIWLDAFVRHSRQVDSSVVPGDYAPLLHGDVKDSPVLQTALAVNLHEEGQQAIEVARAQHGCFVVSWDSDFEPGRNVWGWTFLRPSACLKLLRAIA